MKLRKEQLKDLLKVGVRVKVGKECAEKTGMVEGDVFELKHGEFEYDNGLYTEWQSAPSRFYDEGDEPDSIYHLFGNKLENFLDCEII